LTLVTVVIPTFNRASLVTRAIASVQAQTHQPIELIVVDDGSTDQTEAAVRGLAVSNVRYLRHATNQGQCAAINTGILASTGRFVSFLDSDDEWLPEMIQKQLDVFRRGGDDLGVVYTQAGESRGRDLVPSKVSTLEGRIHREALTQGYVSPSIAMLVRRECFDRVGLFDTRFSSFQDDDLCFRLAKEYAFGLVPEMLAVIHPGADDRLTKDLRPYARGWRDLLRKHEADMLRLCEPAALARHYFRAGLLFLECGDRREALAAFARSSRLSRSIKATGGMVVSLLPFPAFWVRLFRSRLALTAQAGVSSGAAR
jgi:glycosyltransferase involved in cell wall biosynthesis